VRGGGKKDVNWHWPQKGREEHQLRTTSKRKKKLERKKKNNAFHTRKNNKTGEDLPQQRKELTNRVTQVSSAKRK